MLIGCDYRDILPDWITDDAGKKSEKSAWDALARELEAIEPGCLAKIL